MHAIPRNWKGISKQSLDIAQNLIYLNHHLIKNNHLISPEKSDSRVIQYYYLQYRKHTNITKPFESLFLHNNLD